MRNWGKTCQMTYKKKKYNKKNNGYQIIVI